LFRDTVQSSFEKAPPETPSNENIAIQVVAFVIGKAPLHDQSLQLR